MKAFEGERSIRRNRARRAVRVMVMAGLLAAFAAVLHADEFLKAIGGDGGGQFIARCPAGQHLTGFELRVGDDVDAIRPVCVYAYGPHEISAPALTEGSGLVSVVPPGALPSFKVDEVAPGWYGGPGGHIVSLLCPAATPIVIGMDVAAEGRETITVNNIHLYCGGAVTAQTAGSRPSAIFDAPNYSAWGAAPLDEGKTKDSGNLRYGPQRCPAAEVAVGLHGRGGTWIDAIGLICAAPQLTTNPRPPVALGRVKGTAPADGSQPVSICEAAKSARARNSPAAASLEAQCKAQTPAVALGRVRTEAPAAGAPPPSICDAAASARDRQSPAAAGLAEQCRALGGVVPPPPGAVNADALAAKGKGLADANELSSELRGEQPFALQRGFDIGMAVTETDTAWGPGKQKILDSLSGAEQEGFKVAASFSLDRNRNADLARIGAAIAAADAVVADSRNAAADARYRLGFDIASGLFGDPALGANGNTATGPGSLAIRNALSAPAQRGFNDSVALHLSRHY